MQGSPDLDGDVKEQLEAGALVKATARRGDDWLRLANTGSSERWLYTGKQRSMDLLLRETFDPGAERVWLAAARERHKAAARARGTGALEDPAAQPATTGHHPTSPGEKGSTAAPSVGAPSAAEASLSALASPGGSSASGGQGWSSAGKIGGDPMRVRAVSLEQAAAVRRFSVAGGAGGAVGGAGDELAGGLAPSPWARLKAAVTGKGPPVPLMSRTSFTTDPKLAKAHVPDPLRDSLVSEQGLTPAQLAKRHRESVQVKGGDAESPETHLSLCNAMVNLHALTVFCFKFDSGHNQN